MRRSKTPFGLSGDHCAELFENNPKLLERNPARDCLNDFAELRICDDRLRAFGPGLAGLFLAFYYGVMGIHGNMNYAASARLPRADVVLGYLRVDLLPWLLIAVLLSRIYLILRRRVAPLLLWDGLAAGGVASFLAYIYLSMFRVHYPAPVDLIALLYLGRCGSFMERDTFMG